MKSILRPIWKLLVSLKLAVVVMFVILVCLIVATTLESMYDTQTAQYFVYRQLWFHVLLALLGVEILCVALDRLPWKPKHVPFLLAHLGILMLLYGSWLTDKFGIDGQLQVSEGETGTAVDLMQPTLLIADGDQVQAIPVRWLPPEVEFKRIEIPDYGVDIVEWITHAESKVAFVPASSPNEGAPALKIKLQGGAGAPPFMRMGQEFWVWQGDPGWMDVQAGGARLVSAIGRDPVLPEQGASLGLRIDPAKTGTGGKLSYRSRASDGKIRSGSFVYAKASDLEGKVIDTGWKFSVQATIQAWIPQAVSDVGYAPSAVQYGNSAPPSAIRLQARNAKGSEGSAIWLGLGDRATLQTQGKQVSLTYYPKRLILPFGIELQRFQIDHYEGTMNPREFSSLVNVQARDVSGQLKPDAPQSHLISMNEPLTYAGYTFYQSSYIDAQPRPVTSVFSVNRDPGRWLKYGGSLILVLGTILLFTAKVRKKNRNQGLDESPQEAST